jgi:alpha-D-ribose 1-methylphosphonate 5-triphosphate synthase subunit PhnH
MDADTTESIDLRPGFKEPVTDAQASFRALLEAISRPGRIQRIPVELTPPEPLSAATAAACLTLVDVDTPLWIAPELRNETVDAFVKFHCGCRIVEDARQAVFALALGASLPPLSSFAEGDPAYPETSTTVIVQVDALAPVGPMTLTGPGIEAEHRIAAPGLREIGAEWLENAALFPCGVDLFLTAGMDLVGLPRTVKIATPSGKEA